MNQQPRRDLVLIYTDDNGQLQVVCGNGTPGNRRYLLRLLRQYTRP